MWCYVAKNTVNYKEKVGFFFYTEYFVEKCTKNIQGYMMYIAWYLHNSYIQKDNLYMKMIENQKTS